MPLRLYVIKPVEEREHGHRHPVQDAIRAQPEYLPDPTLMTQQLHQWRLRHVREFLPSVRRCLRDRRAGSLRAIRTMAGQLARDRRHVARAAAQDLPQGTAAGLRARRPPARRARRPPPARALRARHDDRHVARGDDHRPARSRSPATRATSTAGSSTARAGCGASCCAARFVVTCTEANVRHLKADRARRERPPRLPRAVGGLHAHARGRAARARAQRPPARARRRPARGQEGLRHARRRVRRAARPRRRRSTR